MNAQTKTSNPKPQYIRIQIKFNFSAHNLVCFKGISIHPKADGPKTSNRATPINIRLEASSVPSEI